MNPGLKRRLEQRRKELEERAAAAKAAADESEAPETHDEDDAGQPDRQPSPDPQDADHSRDDDRPQDDSDEDREDEPDDERDDEEADAEEDDWRERFERLSGKTSGLEKERNEALQRALNAEQRLAELEQAKSQNQPDKPNAGKPPSDDDLEQELVAEMGQDAWDYLDDNQRKAYLAVARKAKASAPPVDVDSKIADEFAKREAARRQEAFLANLDTSAQEAYGKTFRTLVNSDGFSKWLSQSRKRSAIFADAVAHQDEEAKADLLDLVAEYRGSKASKPKQATPRTRHKQDVRKPKAKGVTYQEYKQALKDKRHPNKRAAANEVIAAWKKQQE